jgi:hypothetical protein
MTTCCQIDAVFFSSVDAGTPLPIWASFVWVIQRKATIMPFPRGVADNDHLNIMQQAMDACCQELAIETADDTARQRVAFLVTGFMRAGEHDPVRLKSHVIKQYKMPT